MITIEELHFPDPPDESHICAAEILDHFHGRLRYAQRVLSCARCQQSIENTLVCVGYSRSSVIDHAGMSLEDIRAMKEEAHADAV